jgi:type IV pilus assembly protein PilF
MGEYTQAKSYEQRFEKVTRRFSPQSLALAYKVYLKLGQRRTAKNYGTMLVKMYPQSWEAQQYLLNELELIEADTLAKRYKLTQISETSTNSKKRVVKLSPKKALSNNAANSSSLVESEGANQKVIQTAKVPALTPVLTTTKITTKITTNTAIVPASISAATSSSINAALTMGSIETITPVSEQKEVLVSQLPVNPSGQNKRVVVLVAPKLAEDDITKVLIADNKTNTVALAKTEIPLEDREIFQTAKKPAFITEDTPKLEKSLTIDSTQNQPSSDVSNKLPEIHLVTTGDTLFGISIKYNIKIKALRRWNNLTGNKKIRINDKLHLIDPETVNK